jgi:hypothetical protein
MLDSVDFLTQEEWDEDYDWMSTTSREDIESDEKLQEKKERVLIYQPSDISTSEEIDPTLGTSMSEEIDLTSDTSMPENMRYRNFKSFFASEVTKRFFPNLIKSRGTLREEIYKCLINLKQPDAILNVALDEYDKLGNAERLALAGSLLEEMGAQSFPSLLTLARSGRPECDFFTHVIANLHGVSIDDRLEALNALASNPYPDVRLSLLESLHGLPYQKIFPLLQRLSDDENKSVADEARECVEAFEV